MTETQLKALIGCILKYKGYEISIISVKIDRLLLDNNDVIFLKDFMEDFYPYWKIYLTEDDESLVSIEQYLKHYDIK